MHTEVEVSTMVEQASPAHVLVHGAKQKVLDISENYAKELMKYNRRLQLLTKGKLLIRNKQSSGGKDYHGRYFYERYWCEKDQKIKQKFVGKRVPKDWVPTGGFPPCPVNPLEGLKCSVIGDNVIMRADMYETFIGIFSGFLVTSIKWSDE